jgi:F420H(2)-dependent quinone reductase
MRVTDDNEIMPAVGWVRRQLEKIDATGTTDSVHVQHRPVMVVTTRSVRSGRRRRVPLMRVEHEGTYVAVGSAGGQPEDPVWVRNLLAHPEVDVQDGTVHHTGMRARLIDGAERAEWWPRAVEAFPPYADYQERTDRQIPVFLLEPVEE